MAEKYALMTSKNMISMRLFEPTVYMTFSVYMCLNIAIEFRLCFKRCNAKTADF